MLLRKDARIAFICLAFALCFLSVLTLPSLVPTHSHDLESQAALEYWVTHGFQFGVDIIQNVGPYGFLEYPAIYSGFMVWEKLALIIAVALLFTFFLFEHIKMLPAWQQIATIITICLYCRDDAYVYTTLLLTIYAIFSPRLFLSTVASVLLALLSLTKGTCLITSLLVLSLFMITRLLKWRSLSALLPILTYLFGVLLLWVASGQKIINLGKFVVAAIRFSDGYNEALALYGPELLLLIGALAFLFLIMLILKFRLAGFNLSRLWLQNADKDQLALALSELFLLFVAWKHGFVRADIHMSIFFRYALVFYFVSYAGLLAALLPRWRPFKNTVSLVAALFLLPFMMVFSVTSVAHAYGGSYFRDANVIRRIATNCTELSNLPLLFEKLQMNLDTLVQHVKLKGFAEETGNSRVSFLGKYPGRLLYSGLKYTPSPATISFAAWSRWIAESERNFFRDERTGPPYVVYDLKTVDGRLSAQDDSLAQLELFTRYSVVERLEDVLLLKRRNAAASPDIVPIQCFKTKLGDWIPLPAIGPLWVSLKVHEGLASKLIGALYKPPTYKIELQFADGRTESYRVIPRMAEVGFLLRPFITNNEQFVLAHMLYGRKALSTGLALPQVVAFRIYPHKLKFIAATDMDVSFAQVHNFSPDSKICESYLYRFAAYTLGFNAQLIESSTPLRVRNSNENGTKYYPFSASSRLRFLKEDTDRWFRCHYRLSRYYSDTKIRSAGVRFDVLWVTSARKTRTLWSRVLDQQLDAHAYEDATLELPLPPGKGEVVLLVNPLVPGKKSQLLLQGVAISNR